MRLDSVKSDDATSDGVKQMNEDQQGALVIAFACGLLAGAAVALLVTPAKGRDARAWVAERGRSARRGTSAILNRNRAIAIVREEGVRGLWQRLHGAAAMGAAAAGDAAGDSAAGGPAPSAPPR